MDPRRDFYEQNMRRIYGHDGYAQQPQRYGDPQQIMRERLQRQVGGLDPRAQRDMEQQDGMRGGYVGGSRRPQRETPQGYAGNLQLREMMHRQQMLQQWRLEGGGPGRGRGYGYGRSRGDFGTSGGADDRESARRMARQLMREQEQIGRPRTGSHNGGYSGGDDMSQEELMQRRYQQTMNGGHPQRDFRDPRADGPSWNRGWGRDGHGPLH